MQLRFAILNKKKKKISQNLIIITQMEWGSG
jgi:hypothetical protein